MRELARELGLDDERAAQVVLAGYQRWGTGVFARLLGEAACGVWDPQSGELVAASDPFGARPVYYAQRGSQVAVGAEATVVAWLIHAAPDDDATFYRNVRRVPGGHVLVAKAGQVSVRRYWGPPFDAGVRDASEFEARFREVLFDAVQARLEGVLPVRVLLSGGFDSTSVAAASGALARSGTASLPRIRTLSAVFPGLACDESERIAAVRSTLPFEGEVFEPSAAGLTIDDMRSDVVAYDGPLLYAQRDLFDFALVQARASGDVAVVTGHGGDELAADWDAPRRGWLRRTLWRARLRMGNGFANVLEPRWWPLARALTMRRSARVPGIAPGADDERWRAFHDPGVQRSRAWVVGAGDRAGVAVRSPLLDRRLAELVFGTPRHLRPRTDPGRYKPMLVSATGHLLPSELTRRPWKVDFSEHQRRVSLRTHAVVAAWLADRSVWMADRYVSRARAVALTRQIGLTPADGVANIDREWIGVLGVEHWLARLHDQP